MQIRAKKLSSITLNNSQKKWSVGYVGQFAMKFLCKGKVFYSDLFWRKKKQNSQLYNCIFITLPLATNGTELFAVSDRTYKKRAFQSQEVAITTSNTFLRRHLFSSTTCIRSGFYAATRKKRGLQIDLLWFTLILLSSLCSHFTGWINPQTSKRFEIPQWSFIGSHWSSWIQRIPRIPQCPFLWYTVQNIITYTHFQ